MRTAIKLSPREELEALHMRLDALFEGESNHGVGRRLECSEATVRNWRQRVCAPKALICARICRAYGVTERWLLTGKGPKKRRPARV